MSEAHQKIGRKLSYCRIALQYYVAGRFAFLAQYFPVSGNLFHHALEMLLKGDLASQGLTDSDLRKRSHCLPDLWRDFLTHHPSLDVEKYNKTVEQLHGWDDIRYPGRVDNPVMLFDRQMTETKLDILGPDLSEENKYRINLEEMDLLIHEILRWTSVNPNYVRFFLRSKVAWDVYFSENRHAASSAPLADREEWPFLMD